MEKAAKTSRERENEPGHSTAHVSSRMKSLCFVQFVGSAGDTGAFGDVRNVEVSVLCSVLERCPEVVSFVTEQWEYCILLASAAAAAACSVLKCCLRWLESTLHRVHCYAAGLPYLANYSS